MKAIIGITALAGALAPAMPALADSATCTASGNMVLSAKTPQVDLYDAADGKRVMSMDDDKFPTCLPVIAQASNMMLEVSVNGTNYWVPPHMVNARMTAVAGQPICRKLAMGGDQDKKPGSTRALGEGCPKPTNGGQ